MANMLVGGLLVVVGVILGAAIAGIKSKDDK